MRAAIDRMNGFFPMKVLFALLGVLALLANIPPDKPQAGFFSASDLKLVYGVVKSDYAVIPELDRDKRQRSHPTVPFGDGQRLFAPAFLPLAGTPTRSEEHTSELQSRGHLVCRLLLEKKNRRT